MAKKAGKTKSNATAMDQKEKDSLLADLLKKIQSADTPSRDIYRICTEFFGLEPQGKRLTEGLSAALECVKRHKMPARHPCDDAPRSLHDIVHVVIKSEILNDAIYKHVCTTPEERFGYFTCIIEMPIESNKRYKEAIFREFDKAVADAHSESIMAGAITLIFQLSTDEAYDKVCAALPQMDEEYCDDVLRAIVECNEPWRPAGKECTFERALFRYCCKGLDSKEVHLAVTRIAELGSDTIRFKLDISRLAIELCIQNDNEVVVSAFAKLIPKFYRDTSEKLLQLLKTRVERFQDPNLKADMERLLAQ